ncbi:MAG: EAL domain-containing protein [Burkholderiales bacterium]|nr:EAL domain-containing protein [Burkholderiales bacterium]
MSNASPDAFTMTADARGPGIDGKLYAELVRALYSTPKSVLAASLVAMCIMVVAGILSGDWGAYSTFLMLFAAIGLARTTIIARFRSANIELMDTQALAYWERVFLAGAWAFAGLTGIVGAYSTLAHPGHEVEILTSCAAIGYMAGISSRNASRPTITVGQISAICVPFLVGLVLRADLMHLALAAFILSLYISTIYMSRSIHENIVLRHRAHAELERAALYDALTGLKNRTAFIRHINDQLSAASGANHRTVGLVAVDLDRFKDVNDRLGHPAGDAVLKETARRISEAVGLPHEISRIGGDEFLIALKGAGPEQALETTKRLIAVLSETYHVGPTEITCGASIGFAIGPQHGTNFDELMRNADLALYSAKSSGRGQAVAYSEILSEIYHDRVELEYDMRSAITHSELELVYQPIIDPRSGRTICCEALLRWNHPTRGRISPADFIPIAEATGLIVPIGAWAMRAACAEAATWPADVKVAVNLSPLQFKKGREIVDVVKQALAETGLAPQRLELEITESVLIEDTEIVLSVIEEFRAEGIGVSLDDFGTGFSSLGYLSDFPFSKVKIDRKFCHRVVGSTRTRSIIKGISQLTRDLGMELVAEGIETHDQLDVIRELGINAVQGYLFSKPLPVAVLRTTIREPILAPEPAPGQPAKGQKSAA